MHVLFMVVRQQYRGLLAISQMGIVPNPWIRELHSVMKGWMKRLMKVFFDGSAILKEWGMIRLLKGYICEFI